ncbi:MAG: OadG family protein [Clostridiales bacterium]|nr:OadG family protein [Eubacterium sp.]MDD7348391.1 OadG family protein [Clostridiales bacterium]
MIVLAATTAADDITTIPQALVNTVIAMGTVFLVLILISFIISLFKFIPILMDKLTKKEPVQPVAPAPAPAAAPAPKPVVAEQQTAAPADDTQLIAVITAAVAAAMEQDGIAVPADGLVIRSIKKRSY